MTSSVLLYNNSSSVINQLNLFKNVIGRWHEGNLSRNITLLVIFFISILIMTKTVELFGEKNSP